MGEVTPKRIRREDVEAMVAETPPIHHRTLRSIVTRYDDIASAYSRDLEALYRCRAVMVKAGVHLRRTHEHELADELFYLAGDPPPDGELGVASLWAGKDT